jgi:hypothetical protein
MENNSETLHIQKVTILSRLIKETSLTLEEALLLLKEEEKEKEPATIGTSGYGTLTVGSYPPFGTWSTGTSTTYTVPPSFISMSGSSTINNTADDSADLNN